MQAQKAIITFTYYTMANKALWCEKSSQRDFLKWTETKAKCQQGMCRFAYFSEHSALNSFYEGTFIH